MIMSKNHTKKDNNVIKYANKPRHEVRQAEYAITDEGWIKALLHRGAFGTLGTSHNNQPFLTPILFIYVEEDHAIYFHGAQVGRTRANIDLHPTVCFNVSEIGRILPADLAVEFNIEYNSASVFGQAEVIEDKEIAARVLQFIMDKYAPHLKPGKDYTPSRPEDLKRTSVYKIKIEDWSAKQQKGDEDQSGAFYYEHMPIIGHRT
jgi:nitroimidazol reductase NimA-like FMN-containing flavoprotein (pyridoxamine 5'-phosphate oxidase superfamily)